jgi:hypothetical protein
LAGHDYREEERANCREPAIERKRHGRHVR